jgi:modulator of FtsH protease
MPDFSVASHSALAWHEFFVGTIGAAAALTGLLFVAISINLEQILHYPQLPGRAAATLGMLVSTLVVSGFALAPGQPTLALGIEVASVGAVSAVQAVWVSFGKKTPDEPVSWQLEHLATLVLPSIALVVGGVSLVAGSGGGLYWVMAGMLLAFISASINAWVLLVEIKR